MTNARISPFAFFPKSFASLTFMEREHMENISKKNWMGKMK
jgi:hypothetical protein